MEKFCEELSITIRDEPDALLLAAATIYEWGVVGTDDGVVMFVPWSSIVVAQTVSMSSQETRKQW